MEWGSQPRRLLRHRADEAMVPATAPHSLGDKNRLLQAATPKQYVAGRWLSTCYEYTGAVTQLLLLFEPR